MRRFRRRRLTQVGQVFTCRSSGFVMRNGWSQAITVAERALERVKIVKLLINELTHVLAG